MMPGSLEEQYIRLEVMSGKNLRVPSRRMPAGVYISMIVHSRGCWKSAISVLSSNQSVVWGNTVTLPSHTSPALSVEIRASYEADRILGNGEVIGKLQMPWDELLDHGDEPFDLSFPPVRNVCPSLTLKAAAVHACDDQDSTLSDSLVDSDITRDTDAGHARLAGYMRCGMVFLQNDAVQHFQSVLDQCPVGHPDHAAALTNLAYARLEGYIQNHLQDIDTTTSLFRKALALRPQGHPDHASSLYNLIIALNSRYSKESTAVYIHESAQLCCKLLPLCPERTYLRSIGVDGEVDYVINNFPIDASDEGIHLRRNILKLCPVGYQLRPGALHQLAQALETRFQQCGNIDDIDETIQLRREAVFLCPEGHSDRSRFLNNLALSLAIRFDNQGKPNDLDEAITLYEESLHLWPVGHEYRNFALDNLGGALVTRFKKRGDIDDITRAIILRREALTLCPPGHPGHDTILNNLALALITRYDKSYVSEDLNEAIDLYRESHLLMRLDHPERHITLCSLSRALCSRFTHTRKNGDVEEAIQLCQEALASLPSLHPDRYFSYRGLKDAYLSRYQIYHDPADLSLALENFRLSSRHPTQGFPDRIVQAYYWTIAAEQHRHGSALEAYSTFFELLDAHLATRSSATSRHEAAAAFDYARSLPWNSWKQGRGQQWSLASRLKTSVEDLESSNPKLAHDYLELSKRVSNAAQSSAAIINRAAADRTATEYRRLTRQWEAVVAKIRDLRAFSRFLLPPSYEDLQAAARHGPVIILIASQYSCSAIIVPTSGDPLNVPLPSVSLTELNNLKDRFARANTTRVCHGPKNTPSRQMMKKRVTPSFATIGQGQPGAGKGKALLAVDSELELVHKLVPAAAKRITISGDTATRAGALQALEENTWVHLACHGKQDPTQPYDSHFVMRDEHLTLLDIMEKDTPHAEFAFLSACHTAVGDDENS
ncbi:hypothetical protein BD769DRAFT_1643010 [Suillus cothurnatus]|nr:hypothetical protein BD769DRAFT_1643010 [Suillus cothurnatus]